MMQELKKEFNLTVLFISHDLEVVRHISDRIAVMYRGKIVEMGNTKDVLGYGKHPYTNALVSPVAIEEDALLQGDMKPVNASGCVFYPRCPFAAEICSKREPEMVEVEKGHWVLCDKI